jgi:O-antigen/teichoic acid export membrane protein
MKNYEMGKAYKQTQVAILSIAALALNITLSFLLVPSLSIEGALLAALLSQIFLSIFYYRSVKKNIHATG